MKELIKQIYKSLYNEELSEVKPIKPRTNNRKLFELAVSKLYIDPTPKDEQPDEYACVHSLTTILKLLLPDFPVMTYTPTFLTQIQNDKRFRPTSEFKPGNVLISPTGLGNGTVVGHTGICGENGRILSNSSENGLWLDKYDNLSWVERYSRQGKLPLYMFELLD